jgi:molecular chaperone DnaK
MATVGIDLGTTNSCAAVLERGVPQVIPSQSGARTTPSVVAVTDENLLVVGCMARRQALANPEHTAFAVKRLMGRKFDSPEIEEARRSLPFPLVAAPNGDVHIRLRGHVYSPQAISSLVLTKIRGAAEDYLGERVQDAVVTVPACFDDPQRQATRDAGLIAGFVRVSLINEPTAAALACGLENAGQRSQRVAVYDLGGGSFDITILEVTNGLFQVRATGGNTSLGGVDFDQRIVDWLIREFHRETGVDLAADRVALQRLHEAAERVKCELSTTRRAEINLPLITGDRPGPRHLETVLTRQRYEELTEDLLQATIGSCHQCLGDAGLRADQIDRVLLVGGQTRAPRLIDLVRGVFGREPDTALNPDESVALGAAIHAGMLQGEFKNRALSDITRHALGVETKEGTFTPMIRGSHTVPTRKSRVFTTVADNQGRVEIHVLQGQSDIAAQNRSLAKFELTGIPPAPKGLPQIEVTFEVDGSGILSVKAEDRTTGRGQDIVVCPSGGLSQADVGRLAAEAQAREVEDEARKDQAIVRQLEGLVRARLDGGTDAIHHLGPGGQPVSGCPRELALKLAREMGATIRAAQAGAVEIEAPPGHHLVTDDDPGVVSAEHWSIPTRTLFIDASPPADPWEVAARRLQRCAVEPCVPACTCAGKHAAPELAPRIQLDAESQEARGDRSSVRAVAADSFLVLAGMTETEGRLRSLARSLLTALGGFLRRRSA